MTKKAYLLTEAQAKILAFAAKTIADDPDAQLFTPPQYAALQRAREALAQPLTSIVPQADHEHARRYRLA